MDSSEPRRRQEGGATNPPLRRNFSIKLTLREHVLLLRASAAARRSRQDLLREPLVQFFRDLERQFPDPPGMNPHG